MNPAGGGVVRRIPHFHRASRRAGAQSKAQGLILGGEWLAPALPDGKLADGSDSGVPADAEKRWRICLPKYAAAWWSADLVDLEQGIEAPPPFLDAVDQLYLTLTLAPGQSFSSVLGMDLPAWLDGVAQPAQLLQPSRWY